MFDDKSLEKAVHKTLKQAAKLRRKADDRQEFQSLSLVPRNLLSISVNRFDNAVGGVNYLMTQDVGPTIRRLIELNSAFLEAWIHDGGSPKIAVFNDITLVHIAWLVDEWDAAFRQLEICLDTKVKKHFGPPKYWAEYHRAIRHLVQQKPYEPTLPKVQGYQKYWVPYLHLVAELTHGRDHASVDAEIAASFAKRNRDKRLTNWQNIDGDGREPVKWDFRAVSIHRLWNHITAAS